VTAQSYFVVSSGSGFESCWFVRQQCNDVSSSVVPMSPSKVDNAAVVANTYIEAVAYRGGGR
jgi:hypothetical protein